MYLDGEYAARQHARMRADHSVCKDDRQAHLALASSIADWISALQRELGAAAAYAWSMTHVSAHGRA